MWRWFRKLFSKRVPTLHGCYCIGCKRYLNVLALDNKEAFHLFAKEVGGEIYLSLVDYKYHHQIWYEKCIEGMDYGYWIICGEAKVTTKTCE